MDIFLVFIFWTLGFMTELSLDLWFVILKVDVWWETEKFMTNEYFKESNMLANKDINHLHILITQTGGFKDFMAHDNLAFMRLLFMLII